MYVGVVWVGMAESASKQIPDAVREIKEDRSKALRAPKELTEGNPEGVDDARTAARFIGEQGGTAMFEVVTTKLRSFPEGKDMRDEHSQVSVCNWARAQDPEIIDASEEEWSE